MRCEDQYKRADSRFSSCAKHCVQGYIQDQEDLFRVPFLARLSAPGSIFDPQQPSSLISLIPILVTSGAICILNSGYSRIAMWLTAFENHASPRNHTASLIAKRFLFEAFASYIALFYLAFWQLDARKAKLELQALFTADCVRRLGTEILVPYLLQRGTQAVKRREVRCPLHPLELGWNFTAAVESWRAHVFGAPACEAAMR